MSRVSRARFIAKMYEDQKLADATHFLDEMVAAHNDPPVFHRKLRAFLSSARSVLQYAEKETNGARATRRWYNTAVSKPIIKLMRKERNVDVHEKPVTPDNDVAAELTAGVSTTGTLGIAHRNLDQKIMGEYVAVEEPVAALKSSTATADYTYFFHGKRAAGDAISLSKYYLTELRKIVADEQAKGFLT